MTEAHDLADMRTIVVEMAEILALAKRLPSDLALRNWVIDGRFANARNRGDLAAAAALIRRLAGERK